jgi:hypothetical protein
VRCDLRPLVGVVQHALPPSTSLAAAYLSRQGAVGEERWGAAFAAELQVRSITVAQGVWNGVDAPVDGPQGTSHVLVIESIRDLDEVINDSQGISVGDSGSLFRVPSISTSPTITHTSVLHGDHGVAVAAERHRPLQTRPWSARCVNWLSTRTAIDSSRRRPLNLRLTVSPAICHPSSAAISSTA